MSQSVVVNYTIHNVIDTQEVVAILQDDLVNITKSTDFVFLLFSAVLVFSMQLGFSLLEIGCVSMRNTSNILYQNLMDAAVASIVFFLVGFGFSYGSGSSFIGWSDFMGTGSYDNSGSWAFWFLEYAFAATTSSIVAGAVAERCRISTYVTFAVFQTGFIYPVVVHWVWSNYGWASPKLCEEDRLFGVGAIDFAGSTVVHSVGGLSALVGCIFLGARRGRFDREGRVLPMPEQSMAYQTVGTFLLWIGWYGFNVGSTISVAGELVSVASHVAAHMTLSAAMGGLSSTLLDYALNKKLQVRMTNNGILTGLVAVTAGCGVTTSYGAMIIGAIAGVLYQASSMLLLRCKIDDVVDAVPVHLVGGIWGTFAIGFFAYPKEVEIFFGTGSCGVFYECNGNGKYQLAAQIVLILANIAWTGGLTIIMYMTLRLLGLLRVDREMEEKGLDISYHGGVAYQLMAPPPTNLPEEYQDLIGSWTRNRDLTRIEEEEEEEEVRKDATAKWVSDTEMAEQETEGLVRTSPSGSYGATEETRGSPVHTIMEITEEVVNASPIRESPVRESPVRESPVIASPVRESPVRESPVIASPVRESPMTASPVRESPVTASPLRESPVIASPARESPVMEEDIVLNMEEREPTPEDPAPQALPLIMGDEPKPSSVHGSPHSPEFLLSALTDDMEKVEEPMGDCDSQ